jgi:hypothetical protein
MNRHQTIVPEGLSNRARSLISTDGVRVDLPSMQQRREFWLGLEIPTDVLDQMARFEDRWGGLVLPPAPAYEGGPSWFQADMPEVDEDGWMFWAGEPRCSVAFSFWIGPNDEFGLYGPNWTPLHASVDGWVESIALSRHAARWARQITRLRSEEVDAFDLSGFEPVAEVRGLADTWWKGAQAYVAIYRGESLALADGPGQAPKGFALLYEGLPEWA